MKTSPALLGLVFLILASPSPRQAEGQSPSEAPNASSAKIPAYGVVSGHVYLGDTKSPARNATVYLQPTMSLPDSGPSGRSNGEDSGLSISIETAFDGSYSFPLVPYGSYYVTALQAGYVSPYTRLSIADGGSLSEAGESPGPEQKAARKRVLKSIPQVDVQSILPVNIDVVLERGGAINGTVSYDDGTPATGVQVSALIQNPQAGKEPWIPFESVPAHMWDRIVTDDRGSYRISGLPAGKYIVVVKLSSIRSIRYISSHSTSSTGDNGTTSSLTIFSGNTPRLKDASSFSIALGEERSGEDIQIPMSKLHTVSGNFVSALDGHMVNAGMAVLSNADDKSFVSEANATKDNPGFTFYLVCEGDYILSSSMSADVDFVEVAASNSDVPMPPPYESRPRHFYGAVSIPIHVGGDMHDVTIAVPEPNAKEAQMFKAMQQQMEQQQQQQNPSGAPR